ncbi:thiamine biosynthesis protein ThiF [bacterium]|nr:thiamine biosynthesis protein ThiF [bacterium]MBU1994684.1 thiamine biosynthesis protein ThiF [bacterium]
MIHGFDLSNPLICEGIVGEGCGGGRIFLIEESILKAYDPQTNEAMTLLKDIHMPRTLRKKGCILYIECEEENIEFDLSAMAKRKAV